MSEAENLVQEHIAWEIMVHNFFLMYECLLYMRKYSKLGLRKVKMKN